MSKLKLNNKNPSIKRILRELKDLKENPSDQFSVEVLEDNLFDIHFTILGPQGTEFENGRYHGRIVLPSEYPFKPPNIMLLTPNGRFQLFTKICLSITGYHPEFWQPAWGIRTVLVGLISFLNEKAEGAIGGIDCSKEERQRLAKLSLEWMCDTCNTKLSDLELNYGDKSEADSKEDELVKLFKFAPEKPKGEVKSDTDNSTVIEDNQTSQQTSDGVTNIKHIKTDDNNNNNQSSFDEVNASAQSTNISTTTSVNNARTSTNTPNPIISEPKPSPNSSPSLAPAQTATTNNNTSEANTLTQEQVSTRLIDTLIILSLAILLYYVRGMFIQ